MLGDQDAPVSLPSDLAAIEKHIEDMVQHFNAALKAQREEIFQTIRKNAKVANKASQGVEESLQESQQK